MTYTAKKVFEVEEGTVDGGWHKITVRLNGKFIEEFLKPTQREARQDFEAAGYKRI